MEPVSVQKCQCTHIPYTLLQITEIIQLRAISETADAYLANISASFDAAKLPAISKRIHAKGDQRIR